MGKKKARPTAEDYADEMSESFADSAEQMDEFLRERLNDPDDRSWHRPVVAVAVPGMVVSTELTPPPTNVLVLDSLQMSDSVFTHVANKSVTASSVDVQETVVVEAVMPLPDEVFVSSSTARPPATEGLEKRGNVSADMPLVLPINSRRTTSRVPSKSITEDKVVSNPVSMGSLSLEYLLTSPVLNSEKPRTHQMRLESSHVSFFQELSIVRMKRTGVNLPPPLLLALLLDPIIEQLQPELKRELRNLFNS